MRRNLKKLIDKQQGLEKDAESAFDDTDFKGKIKNCDRKTKEMSEALEREEEKAREVIRGKFGEVGYSGAFEKRVVEKDDDSDEFYDRTIMAKTQEIEQKA